MRSRLFIAAAFATLLAAPAWAADTLHRYESEAGMVKYQLTGMQTGTRTVYWDQFGAREVQITESTMTVAGSTMPSNSILLMLPEFTYNIDTTTKTGMRIPGGTNAQVDTSPEGRTEAEIMGAMGGTQTGSEEIAGRPCNTWSVPSIGVVTCMWAGMALRTETTMTDATLTTTAVEVTEGPVDAAVFEVPSDVTLMDLPVTGGQ